MVTVSGVAGTPRNGTARTLGRRRWQRQRRRRRLLATTVHRPTFRTSAVTEEAETQSELRGLRALQDADPCSTRCDGSTKRPQTALPASQPAGSLDVQMARAKGLRAQSIDITTHAYYEVTD
uniref:(northern house mosquito) hypothetical protein n=1 Tax=Culex pipiens TaxID=7175 RepID=A0A8D8HA05_CULPI